MGGEGIETIELNVSCGEYMWSYTCRVKCVLWRICRVKCLQIMCVVKNMYGVKCVVKYVLWRICRVKGI